ncbi:hypothetical protein [Streptomyces sp. NPDC127098]|uniref:hypothetical protein n=1 Tax=Streptomyces sp. NPDC127098 TaxID=3347137 RepID=UPI00366A04FF
MNNRVNNGSDLARQAATVDNPIRSALAVASLFAATSTGFSPASRSLLISLARESVRQRTVTLSPRSATT